MTCIEALQAAKDSPGKVGARPKFWATNGTDPDWFYVNSDGWWTCNVGEENDPCCGSGHVYIPLLFEDWEIVQLEAAHD